MKTFWLVYESYQHSIQDLIFNKIKYIDLLIDLILRCQELENHLHKEII